MNKVKKMQKKRLFLFAGYDSQGIIDKTLMRYLQALSDLGDVIFVMDNDAPATELSKLKEIPNILYASAVRHGEYDFGSYKRAYQYADKKLLLNKYDWIYLVNDSVYGPLFDIGGILNDLESRGVDLTGMNDFKNNLTPVQVQSWFVGLSRRVATAPFIREFMNSICHQAEKQLIVLKYEVGLSQIILRHGYKMSTFISGQDGNVCHSMYEAPLEMLKAGMPFIKKAALTNLLGMQYLYPFASEVVVDEIYKHAVRVGIPVAVAKKPVNVRPKYVKYYRLTFLSIPIVTVWRQRHEMAKQTCYKVYFFDYIPFIKISIGK